MRTIYIGMMAVMSRGRRKIPAKPSFTALNSATMAGVGRNYLEHLASVVGHGVDVANRPDIWRRGSLVMHIQFKPDVF